MSMLDVIARRRRHSMWGERGRGAPAWPPPIQDNLVYALDFRSKQFLTLGGAAGNEILSVQPRVGSVSWTSQGAGDPTTPTWDVSNLAVFDEADDYLTGSGTVATSGDNYTLYRLLSINTGKGGMFASTLANNDYDTSNVGGEVRNRAGGVNSMLVDAPYGAVPWTENAWHVQTIGYDESVGRMYGAEDGTVTCIDLVVPANNTFSFNRLGDYAGVPGTYVGYKVALFLVYDNIMHSAPQMSSVATWMAENRS